MNTIGTYGTVTNGLLGSVQVTKQATKKGAASYAVTADFPSSSTSTVTVSV